MADSSRETSKNERNVCVVLEKQPLVVEFKKFCSESIFIATPIDELRFADGKSVKSCLVYLTNKNKISPGSPRPKSATVSP